ncbi:Hachiman antiphage defense system protein HamA [Halobacillus sp. MO56]
MQSQVEHTRWLLDTGKTIKTEDGRDIDVWEFRHEDDENVLSQWANHFRNHYCTDEEIDFLRNGTGLTRSEYLTEIKFPDSAKPPGPSIRAGDFAEILVSDYLEYILNYWVPRTRYSDKTIRNESSKGCDIIGFKYVDENEESLDDTLTIFEAKAQFTGKKPKTKLQEAIEHSAKDQVRKAESLNAIKQNFYRTSNLEEALKIERFQNKVDNPFKELSGAVALFSSTVFDEDVISKCNATDHPNLENLELLVVHGNDMMNLVTELYRRAGDEA